MSNFNNDHPVPTPHNYDLPAELALGKPIGDVRTEHPHIPTSNTSQGAPVGTNFGGNIGTGVSGSGSHVHDANCDHSRDHHSTTGSHGVASTLASATRGDHVHDANCDHSRDHLSGSTTSGSHGLTSGLTGAKNTTSGDRGIGHGSGGTTAFESDASKVGESRSHGTSSEHGRGTFGGQGAATAAGLTGAGAGLTGHSHDHSHSTTTGSSGLTGNNTSSGLGSRTDERADASHGHRHDVSDHKADFTGVHEKGSHGLGKLHGERDLVNESGLEGHPSKAREMVREAGLTGDRSNNSPGLTSGSQTGTGLASGTHTGSGLTGSHGDHSSGLTSGSHGHHGAGAAVGAGAAGLAAGVGLTGREATRRDADGVIADSVTGQTHFVEGQQGYASQGLGQQGLGQQGLGQSHGLGAGAAGLAGGAGLASQGQGHSLKDKLTGGSHGANDGPLAGIKQELKAHESGEAGHAVDHPESKGPHGLVWHNGKYVHEREISGHGSTGVPLR